MEAKSAYDPFSCGKYLWYCCNGKTVKHFDSFVEMMDFLISDEGKGWWPL